MSRSRTPSGGGLQAGKAPNPKKSPVRSRLPDPLLLHVLNLPVPVQDLEDRLAFRFLQGMQVDFVGHVPAPPRPELKSRSWPCTPVRRMSPEPRKSPTCFGKHSLSYFIGNRVARGFFFFFSPFLTVSHSAGEDCPARLSLGWNGGSCHLRSLLAGSCHSLGHPAKSKAYLFSEVLPEIVINDVWLLLCRSHLCSVEGTFEEQQKEYQ